MNRTYINYKKWSNSNWPVVTTDLQNCEENKYQSIYGQNTIQNQ